jgi:hypothetical protein
MATGWDKRRDLEGHLAPPGRGVWMQKKRPKPPSLCCKWLRTAATVARYLRPARCGNRRIRSKAASFLPSDADARREPEALMQSDLKCGIACFLIDHV